MLKSASSQKHGVVYVKPELAFFLEMWHGLKSCLYLIDIVPSTTTKGYVMKKYILCFLICLTTSGVVSANGVKRVYELYLQNSTVTLDKKAWRVGWDISYLHDEKNLEFSRSETRGVSGQFSINYGAIKDMELYASLPVIWSGQKFEDSLLNINEKSSNVILGNLDLGASYSLLHATEALPTVTAQLGVEIPLGLAQNKNFTITTGVSLNKSFDPAFLYGGLYYTKETGGKTLNGLSYQVGAGFYINHRLALGLEYSSGYKFTRVNFDSQETAMVTARTIFMYDKNTTIEPYASFGLNDSTPDSIIGINFSRGF